MATATLSHLLRIRGMLAASASALLGVWFMAAPAVLQYGDPAQTNDHIVGPLIVSFAGVAIWEVTRSLRWAALALGLWQIIVPWILGYSSVPLVNSMAAGFLIVLLSLVHGEKEERYGGGWAVLMTSWTRNKRS